MALVAEYETKYTLFYALVSHNYSLGSGAFFVAVDKSMCISVLTLPPLLLQEEGKHLFVHSVTLRNNLSIKYNYFIFIWQVDKNIC